MHSVLGITAAHVAFLEPSSRSKYQYLARQNHVEASKLFRIHALSVTSKTDPIAILTFCMLTMLTSVALMQAELAKTKIGRLDHFIDCLLLLRQSLRFVRTLNLESLEQRAIEIILVPAASGLPKTQLPLDSNLIESLKKLDTINETREVKDFDDKAVVTESIAALRDWYRIVPLHPRNLVFVVRWAHMVPDQYYEALQRKNPLALAVLIHWFIPLCNNPDTWALANWPQQIVAAILEELGDEWSETMAWVRQETGVYEFLASGIV